MKGIAELVKKLIDHGYVEKIKDIEDKRVTYVILTDKGWQVREKFESISKALVQTAYNSIQQEEREELIMLLEKVYRNFQE